MTHRFYETVAGADDASADDGVDLKWEFDDDLVLYVVFISS